MRSNFVVGILLAVFLIILVASARFHTLTYDEADHLRYGMQILELNSNRFDDSKMPFSAINALPGKLASFLPDGTLHHFLGKLLVARTGTMLFAVLVAFFVYRWSKALYGGLPALFTLFLFTFEPNIIAHSQLATTDVYAMGMIALATYSLWAFSRRRDWKHVSLLAVTLGLAQLSKYTAVFLYPLFAAILLIRDSPDLFRWASKHEFGNLWTYLRRMLLYASFVLVISLLVINIGFLFNRTFTPLKDYPFKSSMFQTIQKELAFLPGLRVPVPYPYLEGLDFVRFRERTGEGYAKIYLLGELSKQGFPGYYFYAWLYKVPLAIQVSLLLSAVLYALKRKGWHFLENELFLLGPVLFFSIYFNYFYRAQIGIRFFLVVFPFLLIFCGNLLQGWRSFGRLRWASLGALSAYLVISVLSYYPHYIPYFNELVLDRRMAYQYLADSNIDWGQNGWFLRQYWSQHPGAHVDPEKPTSGRVIVGVNNLVGITAKSETYRWLRENFRPIDTVGYSYLVYDISPEQLKDLP